MRKYNFSFEILDRYHKYVKNVYPVSCQVDYDSLSVIKLSVNMLIKDDGYNYNGKYLVIKSYNEVVATVIIVTSIRDRFNKTIRITGYDCCILIQQQKAEIDFITPSFTNIINYVGLLLFEYSHAFSSIESNATNKAEIYFNAGMSTLEIINNLLNLINFSSLLTDRFGVFYAQKYELPSDRTPEIIYTDDKDTSIIYKNVTQEIDIFNVPNVFIRVSNNSAINPPVRAEYINDNPDSILSTVSRDRRIIDYKQVSNVADSDTLFAITKKDCYNSSDIYEHIEIETAINTEHWYLNLVELNLKSYEINDNYVETSWSIDNLKAGGRMKHKLRRVIRV
ncbi:hypothetical protein HMPREF9629_00422 [Peptoanaerobacter stomatis]|uniref:Uncharacterized protein n=1 Tax=Peptoanaerobacter stomatis TaxID=796937 RepID=G9X1Z9_9FIRM|nr:hypothetical protein [Peptoanaerobacter stomatis]EHL13122.1 hypothetical protein HMPREF9629_00422 [Peptoanaerobacter stomatis]